MNVRTAWILGVFLQGCGGTPCSEGVCDGELFVDMSGPQPVFSLEGASAGSVVPDQLSVGKVLEDPCGDGWSSEDVWELEGIEGSPKITYGVAPQGARQYHYVQNERVEGAPPALEEGQLYIASYAAKDGRGAAAGANWHGFFVAGDPESSQTEDELCSEAR